LTLAACFAWEKRSNEGEVSCTGVLFTAVVLLTDYAELIPDDGLPQWERDDLASMKNVAEHVKGPKFLKIAKDYYRSFPPVIRDDNLAQTKLTYTLKDALKALRLSPTPVSLQPVGAALLLKAVLGNKEAYLQKRLDQIGGSADELLGILSAPEIGERERREPETTERRVNEPPPPRDEGSHFTTFGIGFDRKASAHATWLGTGVYCAAIASLLRTATGEFCFGLFGPWGIGKTSLAVHLEPLLARPENYVAEMADHGIKMNAEDPAVAQRYDVVWFSAWAYRRIPEAWIFLYETLADHCLAASHTDFPRLERFSRTLRTGIIRHGYWPLVGTLLGGGISLVPFLALLAQQRELIWGLVGLFGVGGTAYLVRSFTRGRETARALGRRYASLSRHGDQLGMQGLLGNAVRALLVAWIPDGHAAPAPPAGAAGDGADSAKASRSPARSWMFGAGGTVDLVRSFTRDRDTARALGRHCATLFRHGKHRMGNAVRALLGASIPDGHASAPAPAGAAGDRADSLKASRGSARSWVPAGSILAAFAALWLVILLRLDPGGTRNAQFLMLALWAGACALVLWIAHRKGSSPDRVLIIVDDLDRCAPAEIIDLIESLKLLLEDPQVQDRVQVMMLVDEDVLEHAIALKFRARPEERPWAI
jgi:hypothetical protein